MISRTMRGSSNMVRIITLGGDEEPSRICLRVSLAFFRVLSTCMMITSGSSSWARVVASSPMWVVPTTSTWSPYEEASIPAIPSRNIVWSSARRTFTRLLLPLRCSSAPSWVFLVDPSLLLLGLFVMGEFLLGLVHHRNQVLQGDVVDSG